MPSAAKLMVVSLLLSWMSLACGQAAQPSETCEPSPLKLFVPDVSIDRMRLRGKGFDWDHEIQVALPASYRKSDKAYPVLWVTDGLINFDFAVEVVNAWAAKKYWPEMIVVAIGTPPEASQEFLARRDYEFSPTVTNSWGFRGVGGDELATQMLERAGFTDAQAKFGTGGAPKFLAFLVDELRVALQRKYRISDSHTLFGSSGGGDFCTYALFTRPKSFDKYICLSPALNASNYELFRLEEKYAQANKDLPAAVYFAAGEGEILQGGIISGLGIVSSMSRMAEILTLRQYPSLRLWAHIFPGEEEEHGSFKSAGLARGLRAMWADDVDGTRKH
jgi:predicted alpha/beta superfamily hydrolase